MIDHSQARNATLVVVAHANRAHSALEGDDAHQALEHLDRARVSLDRVINGLRRNLADQSYGQTLARLTEIRNNPADSYTEGA